MWSFAIWDSQKRNCFYQEISFGENHYFIMKQKKEFILVQKLNLYKVFLKKLEVNYKKVLDNLGNGYKSLFKNNQSYFKNVFRLDNAENMHINQNLKISKKILDTEIKC